MQRKHWSACLVGLLLGLAGTNASAAVKVKDIAGQWRCTNLSSQYVMTLALDASGDWRQSDPKSSLVGTGRLFDTQRGIQLNFAGNIFGYDISGLTPAGFSLTVSPLNTPTMPSYRTQRYSCKAVAAAVPAAAAQSKYLGKNLHALPAGLKDLGGAMLDEKLGWSHYLEGKKHLFFLTSKQVIVDALEVPPLRKGEEVAEPRNCELKGQPAAVVVAVGRAPDLGQDNFPSLRQAWVVMVHENNEFYWAPRSVAGITCSNPASEEY